MSAAPRPPASTLSLPFAHRVHGTLLRWMYRIVAPRHPRGWLDFHALTDDGPPGTLSIHCHGMARWQRSDVEIVDVPEYGRRGDALQLLRRSVEIFPGEPNAGPDEEDAAMQNPGNFFSWCALG